MPAINNNLMTWLLLGSIAILGGCGLADTSSPLDPANAEDETIPRIVEFKVDGLVVLSSAIIPLQFQTIDVRFNKKIDPGTLEGSVSVSPAIAGLAPNPTLSEDGLHMLLQRATEPAPPALDQNATYQVTIAGTIKDLNGKPLREKEYRFNLVTPKAKALKVSASNLEAGKAVTVQNKARSGAPSIVINSSLATIEALYEEGRAYELAITAQPDGQFCNFPNGNKGTMGQQDIVLNMVCGNVVPAVATAPRWNDYSLAISDADLGTLDAAECPNSLTATCRHGGELRKFVVREASNKGFTGCDEVQISDQLDAFDWLCRHDANNDTVTAISTKLKADKRLADLIDFGHSRWKNNKVTVANTSATVASTETQWWDNPVLPASYTTLDTGFITLKFTPLEVPGAIYVENIQGEGVSGNIFWADKIAYVVQPGVISHAQLDTRGLARRHLWIEGDFDFLRTSSSLTRGIHIEATHHSVLRKVSVTGSNGYGLMLKNAQRNLVSELLVHNNGGSGVILNNPSAALDIASNNRLDQTVVMNNGAHGIQIQNGKGDRITRSRTGFNDQDGLMIERGDSLKITDLASYGNVSHGVEMIAHDDATHLDAKVSLDGIKAAANEGAGVVLAGSKATIANASLVKNAAEGLRLPASATSGTASGPIVSAMNGTDCDDAGTGLCATAISTPADPDQYFVGIAADIASFNAIDSAQIWHKKLDGSPLETNQLWVKATAGSCKSANECLLFDLSPRN